jgi:hypothetical protein
MPRGFLPNTDTGLLAFVKHFSTQISAAPATFGLTTTQATQFAASCQAYSDRLAMTTNVGERSQKSVVAKNTAKEALKAEARRLVSIVRGQAQLSDAQLSGLGLEVRKRTHTPVDVPKQAPTLRVKSVEGNQVTLQVNDSQVSGRRKPADVHGATFFIHVGTDVPDRAEEFRFLRSAGKTTIRTQLPDGLEPGTPVHFTAIWFNAKGEHGPAATPVSMYVQFGAPPVLNTSLRRAA